MFERTTRSGTTTIVAVLAVFALAGCSATAAANATPSPIATMSPAQAMSLYKEAYCPAFEIGNTSAPTDSLTSWKAYWQPLASKSSHAAKLLLHPFEAFPPQIAPLFAQVGNAIQKQALFETRLANASSLTEGASLVTGASENMFNPQSIKPSAAATSWLEANGGADFSCQ